MIIIASLDNLFAAIHQLLLAVTFFIIPIIALLYGKQAQQAAEKAVLDQGINAGSDFLLKHGVKFTESPIEMLLPFGIGILLALSGIVNLADSGVGSIMSWIIEPLVFLVVGFVTFGQVFPALFLKQAFKKADDARLRQINVEALIDAAADAFPFWLRPLQVIRFLLATVGSLVTIALLAL